MLPKLRLLAPGFIVFFLASMGCQPDNEISSDHEDNFGLIDKQENISEQKSTNEKEIAIQTDFPIKEVVPSHDPLPAPGFLLDGGAANGSQGSLREARTGNEDDDDGSNPPVADPNGPYNSAPDTEIMFDGTGSTDKDGTIVEYFWDFGDGNTGTGETPKHTYTMEGEYDVSLKVTDNDTLMDTKFTKAFISGPMVRQLPDSDAIFAFPGSAGFRIKGANSGNEVYLGVPDLGVGGNRIEAEKGDLTSPGTHPITFDFDAPGQFVRLQGPDGLDQTYDFDDLLPPSICSTNQWDALLIIVRDSRNDAGIGLQDFIVGGNNLGDFGLPTDNAGQPGFLGWEITNFDFTQSFTITADVIVSGTWGGNEALKVEVLTGCLP